MKFDITKKETDHSVARPQAVPPSPEIIDVSKPFDFRDILQLVLERWFLILFLSLSMAGSAAFWVLRIPTKYQAKAVLQVEQEEYKLIGADSMAHQDLRSPEALNTIVQSVKNSSVLRRVVVTNNLADDPKFMVTKKGKPTEAKLIRALAGMISVKLRPDTRLVDITVSHRDAAMAEKLANSVAQEYVRQNLYDRFSTTKAANGLLQEEATRLKEKLEQSEKQIQAYREATQTLSIEDRENIFSERIRNSTARYAEAQAARLSIEADLVQMKSIGTNPVAILALPSVQADLSVAELRKRLVEQEARISAMSVEYQPTFPLLLQARAQLADLEKVIIGFAEKVRATVQSSYDAALAREKAMEEALKQCQAEAMELDKKSVGYNVLLRELQSDRALYDSVLKRLKETDVSKGLGQASLTMVEPASQPDVSVAPPRVLVIAGAFLASLISVTVLLYLLRMARGAIRTVDQAEEILQLPVWAAIPATDKGEIGKLVNNGAEFPSSPCSEGFRTLRTTATIVSAKNEKRTMLFTSAAPGEGKTFCSANYAICQAQEGKRTLLIDLDLRKPSVGATFDLSPETPGVTDYLLNDTRLDCLIQRTKYPNLFVLCAGARITNPAEELAKVSIESLLAEASFHFERVIVDTAPINAVSDTFLILPFVDQVCLVVKSGQTPHRAVKRAVDLMVRANVEPSGIVLNYLPQSQGSSYHYYYGQQYKYGNEAYNETRKAALLNP